MMVSKPLRRDNPAATFLWQKIDSLDIESRLRIITDATIDDLLGLYSGAYWYIQPSLYEGFGLPVLEAQACECPVISTLGGSLKEICNNSCMEFGSFNSGDLSAVRTKFIELGSENVKRFSWKKTTQQMSEVYQQCAR